MTYLKFFSKRALKSPVTIVTIGLTLVLLVITLVMNVKTYQDTLLKTTARQDLSMAYHLKEMATHDLQKYSKGSDQHEAATANYSEALTDIQENHSIISQLKKGADRKAYTIALKKNKQSLDGARKSNGNNSDLIAGLKRERLRLAALKKSGFKEQSEDYPVTGFGYLADSFRYLLPVLLTVIMVFVLSQTFAERFVNKLDIGNLMPFAHGSISWADVSAGLVVTLGITILVSGLAFAMASITAGVGHWSYPMFTYISGTAHMQFVATGTVLMKTIPLSLLFLLFTVVVCNFVSMLTRNKMISLFVSIVILIALPLTTWVVVPMHTIAHLLPTTYLFSELTVTGEMGRTFDNYQITGGFGLGVLVITVGIIMVLTWVIDHKRHMIKFE